MCTTKSLDNVKILVPGLRAKVPACYMILNYAISLFWDDLSELEE